MRDLNLHDGMQEGNELPSFGITLRDVSYSDVETAYEYLMET